MAFPGLHPPKVVKATQHPLEDRQHHGPSLHQEGRGYVLSVSPSGSGKGAGVGAPDVRPHTSGLHPHRGKHPNRCSVLFPRDSRSPLRVPGDRGQMGSPRDQPLRQQRLQADTTLLQLGHLRQPRRSRLPFPPISLLKRVVKKLETSRGTFILWEAQTWLASLLTLKVLEVCHLPFMEDLVTDLTMGKPPPILHNLHLVLWRINSLQRLPGNTKDILKAGWRQSTENPYDRAWQSF
jgi:hypothetical protein